jgi:hypothetical protein
MAKVKKVSIADTLLPFENICFSLSMMVGHNKLEGLSLAILFQASLMFDSKASAP